VNITPTFGVIGISGNFTGQVTLVYFNANGSIAAYFIANVQVIINGTPANTIPPTSTASVLEKNYKTTTSFSGDIPTFATTLILNVGSSGNQSEPGRPTTEG
jgi:hypothetical protein